MRRTGLILLLVAVIAVAGGLAVRQWGWPTLPKTAETKPTRAEPAPVAVDVAAAGRAEVRETVSSLGMLRAQQSVPISSQTGGIVTAITFVESSLVDAGTPLMQLDPRIAQAQFEASLAQMKQAQTRLGRSQELSGAGYKSKQSLDDDRTAVESAFSDLSVRRANLELLSMRAPFRGVVGQKMVGLGEYVSPGKTLTWLEDRTVLRLTFHVPERYYPRLALGQGFEVEVDAEPGRTYQGKVALIDTRPDLNQRDIEVRGEIANDPARLIPGLFARVSLTIGRRPNAVVVQPAAVQYTLTGAYVYKLDGDRVRRVPIKVGLQMVDRIEVLEGVAPGDEVVTTGQFNLDDGRRVTVVGRQAAPGASAQAPTAQPPKNGPT